MFMKGVSLFKPYFLLHYFISGCLTNSEAKTPASQNFLPECSTSVAEQKDSVTGHESITSETQYNATQGITTPSDVQDTEGDDQPNKGENTTDAYPTPSPSVSDLPTDTSAQPTSISELLQAADKIVSKTTALSPNLSKNVQYATKPELLPSGEDTTSTPQRTPPPHATLGLTAPPTAIIPPTAVESSCSRMQRRNCVSGKDFPMVSIA